MKSTLAWTVKDMDGKSLVRVERQFMSVSVRQNHLHRCQGLLNNLKSAPANRVIIFSDEKTCTVDPVRNRQNDHYLTFGDVDESVRTLATTKHPASVMSLGFVASDGQKMPLIWFQTGYRLTGTGYVKILTDKLVPWVRRTYPDGNVVLQQDGVPAHTSKAAQMCLANQADILDFWPKTMWPPYSPDANPLDYAFWLHVESKASRVRHPNVGPVDRT